MVEKEAKKHHGREEEEEAVSSGRRSHGGEIEGSAKISRTSEPWHITVET
jgi:hypothetical protein